MFLLLLLDGAAVAQLADESYSGRERARTYLSGRGWEARASLRIGADGKDAEAARACRQLYDDALDSECGLLEPIPEIDSAWYDAFGRWWGGYHAPGYRRELWPGRAEEMWPYMRLVGCDDYPWDNYYTATRLWARGRILNGERAADLLPLVVEMRARDAVFLERVNRGREQRGER